MDVKFEDPNNHKEEMFLGDATKTYLDDRPHLSEKEIFKANIMKFYIAAYKYVRNNLPTKTEMLAKAEIADIELRRSQSFEDLRYFLKKYPVLIKKDKLY